MTAPDHPDEYPAGELLERDVDSDPFRQFARWFADARTVTAADPHAMTLATATPDGIPSARMVLLKDADERGFTFFTNYESRKGREMAANPHAALVFYWAELRRQVRVTGHVGRVSDEESDAYFRSRAAASRLGARLSRQSEVIAGRDLLDDGLERLLTEFGERDIPRPSYWGGLRLVPNSFEFWQSRPNRLHDRLRYTPKPEGGWLIERLSP
jgi:pyridoxamine 5'-phosphate oxidase